MNTQKEELDPQKDNGFPPQYYPPQYYPPYGQPNYDEFYDIYGALPKPEGDAGSQSAKEEGKAGGEPRDHERRDYPPIIPPMHEGMMPPGQYPPPYGMPPPGYYPPPPQPNYYPPSAGSDVPSYHQQKPGQLKLFVGGLYFQNEDDVYQYFSQFGRIVQCMLMKDKMTGRSRGFAFVTLDDPEGQIKDKITSKKHYIREKFVDVKLAQEDKKREDIINTSKKVFVGGLEPSITGEDLRVYFGKFGSVNEAVVLRDINTNASRGFGFVTFEEDDVAEQCVRSNNHQIKGKRVDIKRAEPKVYQAARKSYGPPPMMPPYGAPFPPPYGFRPPPYGYMPPQFPPAGPNGTPPREGSYYPPPYPNQPMEGGMPPGYEYPPQRYPDEGEEGGDKGVPGGYRPPIYTGGPPMYPPPGESEYPDYFQGDQSRDSRDSRRRDDRKDRPNRKKRERSRERERDRRDKDRGKKRRRSSSAKSD